MSYLSVVDKGVLGVCTRLLGEGFEAFIVGGAVRDIILGREVGDFDVATSARPQDVMAIFRRVFPTGIAHGTVTVITDEGEYEVTTFRGDGGYSDGRRPDSVAFLNDIREDLARRDFTINAIALDPRSGQLLDPFDGRRDLKKRLIRAVGDPRVRFSEDGLRIMRAARFAGTLEFDIEDQTHDALNGCASTLKRVSAERKRDELVKLFKSSKPSIGLGVMHSGDFIQAFSGSLFDSIGAEPLWREACKRVDCCPVEVPLRLVAFLGDYLPGEPASRAAKAVRKWLEAMKFDRKTCIFVSHLVGLRDDSFLSNLSDHPDIDGGNMRAFMRRAGRDACLAAVKSWFVRLDARGSSLPTLEVLERLEVNVRRELQSGLPLVPREMAIDGSRLMSVLGLEPGPHMGKLLDALLCFVLEEPSRNSSELLISRARELIASGDIIV